MLEHSPLVRKLLAEAEADLKAGRVLERAVPFPATLQVTRFRVQLTRVAAKDLDALDEVVPEAVVADLAMLSESPIDRPPRVKRLKGFRHPLHRLRSRDHRIVHRIEETLVTILRVSSLRPRTRALDRDVLPQEHEVDRVAVDQLVMRETNPEEHKLGGVEVLGGVRLGDELWR